MVKLNVVVDTKRFEESLAPKDDDDFSNLSACERCVSEGGGCCTGKGSGIFVTLHDVMRISRAKNIAPEDIAFFGEVDMKFAKGVQESDPFMFEAYRDGKVLQLKRKEGHCQFLVDGEGCQIFSDRPAICRMFPFSFGFRKDGTVKVEIPKASRQKDEDCTILQENYYRSNGKVFAAMNTSRLIMETLCSRHVEELKIYKQYVDELAAGVPLLEIAQRWNI